MRRARPVLLPAASLLAAGCEGVQQVQTGLNPAGPQAATIERLWWPVFWLLVAIWVVTMGAVAIAAFRRRREAELLPPESDSGRERRAGRNVAIAVVLTIVLLLGLLGAYFGTDRALTRIMSHRALVIDVTGKQWWWQVEYRMHDPSLGVTTANEIHIPVGEPVLIYLRSTDVIHSFWVPNLHGKKDLIPGQETAIWIQADRPGEYRGECAEFCGAQHARMALWVIAEPRAQWDRWYQGQLAPAPPPADSLRMLGERVFVSRTCVMCHTVRGTPAGGKAGPDLTHIGSRKTIAAGSLPNTTGNLGGWIVNPQSIKPGAKMPANPLEPEELEALLAYLQGLK